MFFDMWKLNTSRNYFNNQISTKKELYYTGQEKYLKMNFHIFWGFDKKSSDAPLFSIRNRLFDNPFTVHLF
jgi:hypothetical protein